jgi:iron complex transport system permease protein
VSATATAAVTSAPSRLRAPWLAGGVVAVVLAVVVGVAVGPVGISPGGVLSELLSHVPLLGVHSGLSARDAAIVTELRLPRVVLALLVGALLSIAGASYQGTFRNPLADPYLLGAGAGAGLMVTLVIVTTSATLGGTDQIIPLAAFVGALGAVAASYSIGRSAGGVAVVTLILAGVAITSFLTAIQAYLLQRNSDNIREVYTWILGRLTVASWTEVALILPYFVLAVVVLLLHRRVLDVLAVGEDEASTLGINVARSRLVIVAAASLATAAAVAVSGLIGFVGIIVPHTVRMVAGPSYRVILPLSILFGGAFLVFADLLGRTLIAPAELPIGVITAFIGAPFFLVVLRTSLRSRP